MNLYKEMVVNAFSVIEQSLRIIYEIKDLIFQKYRKIDANARIAFQRFFYSLEKNKINLENSWKELVVSKFESLISVINHEIDNVAKIIFFNNPKRQLKLGYSIVRLNGKILKSVENAKIGENLDVCLSNGFIISTIKKINKINKIK